MEGSRMERREEGLGRVGAVLGLFGLVVCLGWLMGCCVSRERNSNPVTGEIRGNYSQLVDSAMNLLSRRDELRDEHTRRMLIRDLGASRDPQAKTVYINILLGHYLAGSDAGDQWERDEAAYALGRTGDLKTGENFKALPELKRAIDNGRISREVGVTAIGMLAFGDENTDALDFVLNALGHDPEESVRLAAVNIMASVTPKQVTAWNALQKAVRSDASMRVRAFASCVLFNGGDTGQWAFIKVAAADHDPLVREEVAVRIEFSDVSVPLLLKLLGDEDENVRGAAWEPLEKKFGTGESPWDRTTALAAVEKYRQAWEASRRK